MADFNSVTLVGRLTRDPVMTYTPSNTPVTDIGLAINRKWTRDGQTQEEVCFVDCTAFGKTAETINEYCKKGKTLLVQGRLKLDQWKAKDGTNRSKLGVVVDKFQFMDPPQEQQAPPAPYTRPASGQEQFPPAEEEYPTAEPDENIPF